ncbi:C2 domain-containing protein [Leucosporidium creatinivorum]|uniref:C2 domain-containing protein n=1 Tax=Leucosporidium creatinivorum TaxID=106004 RepID=A0A1Y2DX48_9BASI|nr:C2 domain-containing protein [Leucosporidium creatinivorum]
MTAIGRPVTPNGDASPTATSPRKQSAVLGTLIVVVLRAKNLTNRVRIGKQNPYCTVTYGLNKKRTETIERGGQQPTWDSEFRFELLRDERDQLGGDGANALVNKHGGVMPMAAASEQAKLQAAQASASTTSSNGKRVLKLACYADDVKDPKLVGEGVLELEETIKKGAFDDWVKLERKGRYAGEIYLELTWYSSDPPPERPPQRQEPLGAYGGPGSRTDDFSDDDRSNTEEWDGSEVGPSPGALDVAADYPDPDLAPLSHSMSTLSVNQRPPLPAPPPASNYQRQPSYGYGAPPPQNGGYQQPLDRRASYAGGPGGSYGAPAPNYGGAANEFGGYDGGQHGGDHQATIGASTQGRVSGFQQLVNQHYASQGESFAASNAEILY